MKTLPIIILLSLIAFSCQKELSPENTVATLPTLTTTAATSITNTTAASGGNITDDGGAAVTARGVCWSTTANTTIALSTKTTNGTGIGIFTSAITGLNATTVYYVRAYATNSAGTAYGNEIIFTSTNTSTALPTVSTATTSAITMTTAASGGNVTNDGGATVTARGVCWSATANPTIALSTKTTDGTGTGIFTSAITGLTAATTYHVRAYATNSVGTSYGGDSVFITTGVAAILPTVTTTTMSSITSTTAAGGGNVTSDGGAAVTARGVCWSTTANPVATGIHTTDGSGTGAFTSALTNLIAGTTYHVRAYATNSVATAYGGDSVFTTAHDIYVGGYQHIGSGTVEVATIWKNGIATTLTSGVYDAYVTAIFVSGQDVYAVGTETQIGPAGLTPYAMLWKNGIPTRLSGKWSGASSVYVSGSDVYVGGAEDSYAAFWKNGVVTVLSSGAADYGSISGVFVYGTDVYLSGGSALSGSYVWKNGVVTILGGSTPGNSVRLTGIFVSNGDVYVSGIINYVPSQDVAAVWKNGVSTSLTNGNFYSYAQAVYVVNNDVYVTGIESDGTGLNTIRGKVWKNGVVTLLAGSNTGGNAVRVLNADVYVAGTANLTAANTANLWKNGVPTVLSPAGVIADAYALFIK
jgi:hypothetical protein